MVTKIDYCYFLKQIKDIHNYKKKDTHQIPTTLQTL